MIEIEKHIASVFYLSDLHPALCLSSLQVNDQSMKLIGVVEISAILEKSIGKFRHIIIIHNIYLHNVDGCTLGVPGLSLMMTTIATTLTTKRTCLRIRTLLIFVVKCFWPKSCVE